MGEGQLELLRDEGIDVLLRTRLLKLSDTSGESLRADVDQEGQPRSIEATDVLVATGRTPNTRGIGLEESGVELDEKGYIRVNDRLETTAPGVRAMGECAGSPQFTHVSFDDFRVVRDNLKGGNRTTRDRLVPYCIFTDLELACVGLNERQAQKRGIAYRVAKMPERSVLRTLTLSETRGFLKILIEDRGNGILGFAAFATGAGDLMAIIQTAMLNRAPFFTLRDTIFTHPTMAEGLVGLLSDVEVRQNVAHGKTARSAGS